MEEVFTRKLSVGDTELTLYQWVVISTLPHIHEHVVFPESKQEIQVIGVVHDLDGNVLEFRVAGDHFKSAYDDASEHLANLIHEGWDVFDDEE